MTLLGREVIHPASLPAPPFRYSHAIKAGPWVFPSGQLASDYRTGIVADAGTPPGRPLHGSAVLSQSRTVMRSLDTVLTQAGSSVSQLARIDQYLTERHLERYLQARNEFITNDRPASTAIQVAGFCVPGAKVAVDAVGVIETTGFTRRALHTDKVAQPLAGYSVGIEVGPWVFCAGASPTDFKGAAEWPGKLGTALAPEVRVDPNFWYGSEIKLQARYDLKKLAAYLAEAGTSLGDAVKAQVWLTNMEEDFLGFQEVWHETFGDKPPATTVLPVTGMGIWGSRVEINMIAVRPDSGLAVTRIETDRAAVPYGHQPQAIAAGGLLHLSGLLAADEHGPLPGVQTNPALPYFASSAKIQMTAMLRDAAEICRKAGSDLSQVVKLQLFYLDPTELFACFEVFADAFPTSPPAVTMVQVGPCFAVPGCTIQLDLIATVPV